MHVLLDEWMHLAAIDDDVEVSTQGENVPIRENVPITFCKDSSVQNLDEGRR